MINQLIHDVINQMILRKTWGVPKMILQIISSFPMSLCGRSFAYCRRFQVQNTKKKYEQITISTVTICQHIESILLFSHIYHNPSSTMLSLSCFPAGVEECGRRPSNVCVCLLSLQSGKNTFREFVGESDFSIFSIPLCHTHSRYSTNA